MTGYLSSYDKWFMSKNVLAKLEEKSDISYIIPAKVNSKLISSNNLLGNIVTPLNGYKEASICYKKVKTIDGKNLYAYRDSKIAYEQEVVYTGRSQKNGKFKEENLKENLMSSVL